MGYSTSNPASEVLCNQVTKVLKDAPKEVSSVVNIVPITTKSTDCITTACGTIKSPTFNRLSQQADKVVYGVVTAGSQLDEMLFSCNDTIDALIIDTYGSALVELGVDLLLEKVAAQTGLYISLPFSPGYCDYPLAEQENIFQTLGSEPLGVKYHKDSFMMSPIKTISFIAALGTKELNTNPCSICTLDKCQMRR
jgi:hypothetical protein